MTFEKKRRRILDLDAYEAAAAEQREQPEPDEPKVRQAIDESFVSNDADTAAALAQLGITPEQLLEVIRGRAAERDAHRAMSNPRRPRRRALPAPSAQVVVPPPMIRWDDDEEPAMPAERIEPADPTIVWYTADRRPIRPADMESSHIVNCLRLLARDAISGDLRTVLSWEPRRHGGREAARRALQSHMAALVETDITEADIVARRLQHVYPEFNNTEADIVARRLRHAYPEFDNVLVARGVRWGNLVLSWIARYRSQGYRAPAETGRNVDVHEPVAGRPDIEVTRRGIIPSQMTAEEMAAVPDPVCDASERTHRHILECARRGPNIGTFSATRLGARWWVRDADNNLYAVVAWFSPEGVLEFAVNNTYLKCSEAHAARVLREMVPWSLTTHISTRQVNEDDAGPPP